MHTQPLNLERSVQIAMATMSALGTLLLGLGQFNSVAGTMGQQSVFLPAIAFIAAVSSVVLCDIRKTFRLNRHVANLAALLAVAYALTDFYGRQDSETQLLAIANLLVYLQVVLQFQEKSLRVYWSLSVLSLLQVVVASALNLSFSFGLLLALYLVVSLMALSLLFVYRETSRFESTDDAYPDAAAPIGPGRRWPLGVGGTHWSNVVGDDPGRPLVGKRMVRHVIGMGLVTIVITVLVFYGMPRYRKRVWQGPGGGATSMVGFNDEVSLGEMGRILQSDEQVMRVNFKRLGTGAPVIVTGTPYFRGATLSDYYWSKDKRRGRWKPFNTLVRPDPLPTAGPNEAGVVQEVILQSSVKMQGGANDEIPLFSTYPVFDALESAPTLRVDPLARKLCISAINLPDSGRQYRYVVRSGEFNGPQQVRLSVEPNSRLSGAVTKVAESQPGVAAKAAEIVREAQAVEPMAIALALEDHFRRPNNYFYDLDPDVTRTPGVDPIEDFVMNHRTGHCEYFASALVQMLRSQGIPARMVVGYHGGEFNSLGNYYLVRQKHAHAWVEAYMEPGEYPVDQLATGSDDSGTHGAWLRLDPTPPDYELELADSETTLAAQVGDMLDYAQLLWTDYVLGLNSQRQRDAIYGPISAALSALRSSGAIRWLLYALASVCGLVLLGAGLLYAARATGVAQRETLIATLARTLGAPGRWLSAFWQPAAKRAQARAAMHVVFYDRLESLLRRQGMVRGPSQTQREFAAAAGGRLADVPQLQAVAGIPRRVAEAFYRVRFGGPPLDSREEQAVEQALRDLEAALTPNRA